MYKVPYVIEKAQWVREGRQTNKGLKKLEYNPPFFKKKLGFLPILVNKTQTEYFF